VAVSKGKRQKAKGRNGRKKVRNARARVSAIPKGFTAVTPYLHVRDSRAAIAFYKKAFGARQTSLMTGPGGAVMHAEIQIGGAHIMLGDANPDMGVTSPDMVGGVAGGIMLYVPNADKVWKSAVAAGAEVLVPLDNQFWGDRYGQLKDPFGHKWSIATHIEDMTPREMQRRGDAFMAQFAKAD
jgi:PhnB protein